MKANAPKKIYVSNYSSGLTYNWHNERLAVKDVEYTRTDTFIEKACDAFCKVCKMPNCRRNECKVISNFKEYLETI